MLFQERVTDQCNGGWTNGGTDKPSFREARVHLKMQDLTQLTSYKINTIRKGITIADQENVSSDHESSQISRAGAP